MFSYLNIIYIFKINFKILYLYKNKKILNNINYIFKNINNIFITSSVLPGFDHRFDQ